MEVHLSNYLHPYIVEVRRWRSIIGDKFEQFQLAKARATLVSIP
jgi:hypothetical protein